VQVPEAPCLFRQAITAEPRILVVAGVIKTADPVSNGITDLFFLYELLHGAAVKKKNTVRSGSIDAPVSFADIFPSIFIAFASPLILFVGAIK